MRGYSSGGGGVWGMTVSIGAIDDDRAILYTIKAMADSLGWPIETTDAPEVAMEWVRAGLTDLLFVDYHMPAMSGAELIRRVRQISRSVVIIVLTVEEDPEVAKHLLISGADDFISKPVRLADFSARITLHAELARYRSDMNWNEKNKGLAEDTARKVLSVFENSHSRLTSAEVAVITRLAYPTTHRYLEYLARKGLLRKEIEEGCARSGRPRIAYSRVFDKASKR